MVGETATRELLGEFPNQIIRASAGTGKTFALSNRYLKLLASGAECQTILATTFTRKGAGEILDRIIQRLSDAALDETAAEKLSNELGNWKLSQERAASILHDLLRNLHRLEISTLDSFFNQVAKAFSLELGLPPTWEIVEEQQMNRLNDQAIQAVLRSDSVLSLLHMLSKGEAARGVAFMIQSTVNNIYSIFRESGPGPWDQLPMTGHFLPADKLEGLVDQIENLAMPDKRRLTSHWETVKAHASNGDWAEFASTTSFQNMLQGKNKFGNTNLTPEMLAIYQQALPHCRAFVEHRLIQQNQSTRDLLAAFGELLETAKSQTGELRFDDVTERLQSFVSMWDTDRFSFRLDHQIQHLLLDEFQDTSLAQWNVIRPFAKKVTQDAGSLRSFFCVGDMKQAIFGWRGGVAEIFDLVDDELPNLKDTETMTKSYRSAPEVIGLVNSVFLNLDQYRCGDAVIEDAIAKWGSWFGEHSTQHHEMKGHVTIEMAAECSDTARRHEYTKDSSRNENVIRRTIVRVKELVETLPAQHTIGLIVRTNKEVSELIFRLQQAGVAASEEGGNLITDSAAVELILSAIQLADHPGDSIARFHLSHSPLAKTLGLEPESKLNQSDNLTAAQIAAAQLRQELVTEGYGPTVERLARLLTDKCTQRELLRLQQIVRIAYSSRSEHEQWQLRPSRFVEYIREEAKVSDQSSASVRVMTIHKAKGLEFDVVVFPLRLSSQGWAGRTPTVVVGRNSPTAPIEIATRYANEKIRRLLPENFQALFDDERQRNVREAMCVVYVALTRAVHATHVIVSHGAKVDHQSTAGILLKTLCPDTERREGVLYELGDADWFQHSAPRESADDRFGLNEFYLPEKAELKQGNLSAEIRSGRGVPRNSPSMLEGGQQLVLKSIFQTEKNRAAKTRGRLIHGCFELINWLDTSIPTQPELAQHLKKIDPTIADFQEVISAFYDMIQQDNLRNLLSLDTYQEMYMMPFPDSGKVMLEANRLEVENERRFAVQLDAGILQGVIDRLVMVYEGDRLVAADVIDFKTSRGEGNGSDGPAGLQKQVEFYKPQLAGYRSAVAKMTKLPLAMISTRLAFVDSGQVVNLDLVENSVSPEAAKQLPPPKRKKLKPTAKVQVEKTARSAHKKDSKSAKKKPDDRQQTLWPEE